MEISNKNRPVKIGVLSLWILTLFLVSFIFYIIGSNQKLFNSKYNLNMFLPNIQGLESGAFITLSGLKVGVVGEQKFYKMNGKQGILSELKIERKYETMITESSVATIKTMGVLGDKYVDISLGNLNDPVLKEDDFINSKPPLDVDEIFATTTAAIKDFQITLNTIHKITDQALNGTGVLGTLIQDKSAKKNLTESLTNLHKIMSRLIAGEGNLGKLVQDTTLFYSLLKTSKNLDDITGKIQRGEGSLGKMVSDTTLYARFKSISIQSDALLKKLQGDGTAGKLINDKVLYEQLLNLTKSLNALTQDINQNPKKYVQFKLF